MRSASLWRETVSVVQKYSKPYCFARRAHSVSRRRKHSVQRFPPSGSFSRPSTRRR